MTWHNDGVDNALEKVAISANNFDNILSMRLSNHALMWFTLINWKKERKCSALSLMYALPQTSLILLN